MIPAVEKQFPLPQAKVISGNNIQPVSAPPRSMKTKIRRSMSQRAAAPPDRCTDPSSFSTKAAGRFQKGSGKPRSHEHPHKKDARHTFSLPDISPSKSPDLCPYHKVHSAPNKCHVSGSPTACKSSCEKNTMRTQDLPEIPAGKNEWTPGFSLLFFPDCILFRYKY